MKEQNILRAKDFFVLLIVIIVSVFVCNGLTPLLYNQFGGIHRTNLIIDKLKEPGFSPEMVVLGSSKAMMGIDGYQMTKELGIDVYNFSSNGQPPVESSLYYSLLPKSVKTVIQIIYAPIKQRGSEKKSNGKLSKTIAIHFAMGGYKLDEDIKRINPNIDLSSLDRSQIEQNFDARAAIFIPGLTDLLLPRDKNAVVDLKFCNSFLTKQHLMYERTIEQEIKHSYINSNIEIDTVATSVLNGYAKYLSHKGIKMVAVIMPSNPDVKEFSSEQMEMIGTKCKELIPDAIVLNYLAEVKDTQLFFDATHLNRNGAKKVTALLDKDLIERGIVLPKR